MIDDDGRELTEYEQLTDDLQLLEARAALCDLLIGRQLRAKAKAEFEGALRIAALSTDSVFEQVADTLLAQAAHWEWIACRAEQGAIRWGGRLNRCGYQPREE